MKVRSLAACVVLILLSLPARSLGQGAEWGRTGTPRNERSITGTLLNQDYFTAPMYPEVNYLLALVEGAHFNERVLKNYHAGDLNAAHQDCEYTLERFPNHPGALNMMVGIGRKLNQPGLAITHFEKAIKEYPLYAYTRAQYGHYLVELGAVSAGILELKEAVRLDPNLLTARAWLAQAEDTAARDVPAVGRSRPGP